MNNNEKIHIVIKGGTSDEAVKLFKDLLNNFIKNEDIMRAEISYCKSEGLVSMDSDPKTWPLQIYTSNDILISVYNVTAGYGGSGPHAMKEILELSGFEPKYTKKVLSSKEDKINLIYDKAYKCLSIN